MRLFSVSKTDNRIKIVLFGIKFSFLLKSGQNKIFLSDEKGKLKSVKMVKGVKFKFHGSGAVCILPEKNVFKKCCFELWNNAYLEFKPIQKCWIDNLYLEIGDNSKTIIGSNAKFTDTKIYNWGPEAIVEIGDDCMFSDHTLIRTHDGHALYDIRTQELINKAKNVKLGNHIWVAAYSTILKGATILDNTVIAANSVVTKGYNEKNIVLAGNPAKIVRTNINWDINPWKVYMEEKGAQHA